VLSISSPAGASAVRYYAELAQDGYYTQRCEAPGVWHGSGVKALGLEGEASPEQIENILKGLESRSSFRTQELKTESLAWI